jgi:phosphoglycolate phosphatase-like HAD superfamily hydrolase
MSNTATENFLGDPYLYEAYVVDRLRKEYHKYQRLIIALDFDGTIHDYHKEGYSFPKVIELIRLAKELGCYIYIFTANPDEEYVTAYCKDNDIPFDAINKAPDINFTFNPGKPFYSILLDDRAGLNSAYRSLFYILEEIKTKSKQNV